MQKQYKISFIIYSVMLIFSLLFMVTLWGASGHRIKLNYQHYLIAIFVITTISLLIAFPKIPTEKKQQKLIGGISCLVLLLVSLYFALQNLFSILTENLIIEFKVISTLFVGIFITAIIYLFKQIFAEIKPNKSE